MRVLSHNSADAGLDAEDQGEEPGDSSTAETKWPCDYCGKELPSIDEVVEHEWECIERPPEIHDDDEEEEEDDDEEALPLPEAEAIDAEAAGADAEGFEGANEGSNKKADKARSQSAVPLVILQRVF